MIEIQISKVGLSLLLLLLLNELRLLWMFNKISKMEDKIGKG